MALCVRYEGCCLTVSSSGVYEGSIASWSRGIFFASGLLGNELPFLVEGLSEVLNIGG